jgi:hypothetical protein
MNFGAPSKRQMLTHEEWVAQEAERYRWRREQAAARRERRVVYYDEETNLIEAPAKSTGCAIEDCDRKVKARGLCERDYKRERRRSGRTN